MKFISDFNSNDPNNFSDSGEITIPSDQSIAIAGFELSVSEENSHVFLKGTVGIQSSLELSNIILNILRNGESIGSVQISALMVNERNVESFHFIDVNAPIGTHIYTMTAELINPLLDEVNIISPLAFTGKTIAPAL